MYITHFWDDANAAQFARLQREIGQDYDLVVSGFVEDTAAAAIPAEIPHFLQDRASLALLGYPCLADLPPHHLHVFRFFRQFPDYEHYWLMEYDVRYTGDWAAFFAEMALSRADLLATIIHSRAFYPEWYYWPGFSTGDETIPEAAQVRIFTPLMRLSRAAMVAVDAAYRRGWCGHFEAVWGNAVAAAGLSIEDIGAEGDFTPPERFGRYYTCTPLDPYLTPGSFVFRPSMLEADIPPSPPLLWHPVKSAAMAEALPVAEPPAAPSPAPAKRAWWFGWLRRRGL